MAVTSELEDSQSSSSSTLVKIQNENIENSAPPNLSVGSLREPFEIGACLNVRAICRILIVSSMSRLNKIVHEPMYRKDSINVGRTTSMPVLNYRGV